MSPSIDTKSGSKWTEETLEFFRIKLHDVPEFLDFFEMDAHDIVLNQDTQEFLSLDLPKMFYADVVDFKSISSDMVDAVITAIFMVTQKYRSDEPAVNDLAKAFFRLFKYHKMGLPIHSQPILKLKMSNSVTMANADVCIEMITGSKLLVVQENKSWAVGDTATSDDVSPQLVAEMIAAFQSNAHLPFGPKRRKQGHSEQQMFGIILLGTCPTFYHMHITQELSESVKLGCRPESETILWQYTIPNIPADNVVNAVLYHRSAKHISHCYEGLKHLLSKTMN